MGENTKHSPYFVTDGNFLPWTSIQTKGYLSSINVPSKTFPFSVCAPDSFADLHFSDSSGLLSQNQVSIEFK